MERVQKSKKPSSFKEVPCRVCGNTMKVAEDAVAGECWECLNFPKKMLWKSQGSFMKESATE